MNDKYPSLGYAVISTLNLRNQSKVGKKIFRVPAPYLKKNNSFCLLRRSTKNTHDLWQPRGGILWCDVRQKRLKNLDGRISGQSVPAPVPGNARRRSASFDRTTIRLPAPHFVARPVPQCCWSSWSHWGFQYGCRACDTRTEGTLFRWALKTRSRGRHDPLSASGRFQRKGRTLKRQKWVSSLEKREWARWWAQMY